MRALAVFEEPGDPDFQADNRAFRIANTKVGCWLVIILMPFGSLLDD